MDSGEIEKINKMLKFGYDLGRLPEGIEGVIGFLESSSWSVEAKRNLVKTAGNDFENILKKYEAEIKENYPNVPFATESLEKARKNMTLYQELAKQFT